MITRKQKMAYALVYIIGTCMLRYATSLFSLKKKIKLQILDVCKNMFNHLVDHIVLQGYDENTFKNNYD